MSGHLLDSVPLSVLLAAMDLVEARWGFVDFVLAVEMGWLQAAVLEVCGV